MVLVSLCFSQLDSLRFGLIADPQYADRTSAGRCYSSSLTKIEDAVTLFNQEDLPFIIVLGDVIDGNSGGDGSVSLAELEEVVARFQDYTGDIYTVLGNHDLVDLNKDEFLDAFNPEIKQNYYSFDRGPYHFVVLDGNYIEDGSDYGRDVNWTWTDTWIHQEQKEWLIADLDSAGQRPTFVFTHQNLHDNSSISLNNSAEIREILETHGNVTHVFAGHHHAGHSEEINGIHYLTLKGMVDCPGDENRFASILVSGDTLKVEGHGVQPDYILPHQGLLEAYTSIAAHRESFPASDNTGLQMYDLRGRLVRLRTGDCCVARIFITPTNRRKVYR